MLTKKAVDCEAHSSGCGGGAIGAEVILLTKTGRLAVRANGYTHYRQGNRVPLLAPMLAVQWDDGDC